MLEKTTHYFDFGEALRKLKEGKKVARRGWNGKGIYIEMQIPDEHSKMTLPYIYIVTNGLVTENPNAPKGIVPWLASQTDMLYEDWREVDESCKLPASNETTQNEAFGSYPHIENRFQQVK